jgi:DNA polymerase III epsilon subunit family exonuclease
MKSMIPDDPIIEIPYVAIDTETTGLDSTGGDRILEIAALRFHRGNVIDSFVTLLNPGVPVSHGAFRVHGISNDMLLDAPAFGDIFSDLVAFIGEDPTVYHNAHFDLKFLRMEAMFIHKRWVNNVVIDTLRLARTVKGRFRGNSLGSLAKEYETGLPGHRAMSDAHATGKILLELAYREGEHMTLSELIGVSGIR